MICFSADYMWGLFPDVVMVIISEVAVDVVKHAFITKFNDISADVKTQLIHNSELSSYSANILLFGLSAHTPYFFPGLQ